MLSQIPGARQTESTAAEDKTIWLHYFSAASDHYIAEVWQEPESQGEPARWMGFGYAQFAVFPDLAEWGYIDLDELEQVRVERPGGLPVIVERDLPWQPKPFREIQSESVGNSAPRRERAPAIAERDRQSAAQVADGPVSAGPQRQAERLHSGAQPLTLDQEQAATVLAALDDAAALRREVISNCPDCRPADERVCEDHQGSWEAADDYDQVRWQLEAGSGQFYGPYRADSAQAESAADATGLAGGQAKAETSQAQTVDVRQDEPGLGPRRGDPQAGIGDRNGLSSAVHVTRLDPPPSMKARRDAGNAADAGPPKSQISRPHGARGYQREANHHEADREAGE